MSPRARHLFAAHIRPLACTLLLTVLLAPLSSRVAHGQGAPPTAEARRAAMERLSYLVGDWSGDAWIQTGPGARKNIRQTEHVVSKLGGTALLVEGTGRQLGPDGAVGEVQFNAVAVINFGNGGTYRMRSYVLDGNSGDFDLELTATGYIWKLAIPQGTTRYTMELTPAGEWVEKGEFSPDGTRWFPTMEMRLKRVTPKP